MSKSENLLPTILAPVVKLRNKLFPGRSFLGEEFYIKRIKKLIPEMDLYYGSAVGQIRRQVILRGMPDMRSYYLRLKKDPDELTHLRRNLTFTGSHLFRGEEWDVLGEKCLSTFAGRETVKCWSAGCSSGEEVYSLILALMDYVPLESIDVLATDYNEDMLERCRKAVFGRTHFEEVPEKYREYQIRVRNNFTFSDEIKSRVTTRKLNLLLDDYPSGFDLIICRNVIKFFSPESVKIVQQKLIDSLVPGGFLFVALNPGDSNHETLTDPEAFGVKPIGRSIYQKK